MVVSVRRCASDTDLAASLEIYNTVWPQRAVTLEEVSAWKRSALDAVEFVASLDGVDVGSVAVDIPSQRPNVGFTLLTVLPNGRRRGVGSALYAAASAWAAEHGIDELEASAEADDQASIAFAQRRGFTEHSIEAGLQLDPRRIQVAAAPPPGVEVTSLADRPELAEGTWEVAAEALPDIPGEEDWIAPPRERWVADFLLGPSTPPAALFVAAADGEVVGYAKLRLAPDGRSARHGMTAVKRSWRGQGIARALKSRQIAWAKQQGIERLMTTNEVRNEAMRSVNERLGYVAATGRVTLRGPLSRPT